MDCGTHVNVILQRMARDPQQLAYVSEHVRIKVEMKHIHDFALKASVRELAHLVPCSSRVPGPKCLALCIRNQSIVFHS